MAKLLLLACALLVAGPPVFAQVAGQYGVGVILGQPSGATGKYWLDHTKAIDFHIGEGEGGLFLISDFSWHAWDILPQPAKGRLGLYVSAGGELETEGDGEFGIRTLAGINYWVEGHPIELFFEAGPVFELPHDPGIDVDAAIGVRFYIGRSGGRR